MLSLSIYSYREHSAAQHSAITPAQSIKPSTRHVPIGVHIYQKKYVRIYTHAASGLFSWSIEVLAFASCLFAPKMLDHLLQDLSFRSILPRERAWRAELPATRIALYHEVNTQDNTPPHMKCRADFLISDTSSASQGSSLKLTSMFFYGVFLVTLRSIPGIYYDITRYIVSMYSV